MTLKQIQEEIAETYNNIKNKDVSRKKGEELIESLFMKKREALALKEVPNPKKKPKFKK